MTQKRTNADISKIVDQSETSTNISYRHLCLKKAFSTICQILPKKAVRDVHKPVSLVHFVLVPFLIALCSLIDNIVNIEMKEKNKDDAILYNTLIGQLGPS